METKTVRLSVPGQNEMMLLVRLTTLGVLARANLTLDAADDVKMAVEEAAACLIRLSRCSSVDIRYEIEAQRLRIQLSGESCAACWQGQTPDELGTIRYILESMVDEVKLSGTETGRSTIELIKRLAG